MEQYQAHDIIKQLYYPGQTFSNNEKILEKYASPDNPNDKPIEFPDRISNVNGNHLYKLLSAKDINFNNVLLPNSIVPETNWGSFDEDRRWPTGYPIYINDVYELMNVVDYLLCATEDLWSELNKLKYGSNVITNLWFINNLNGQINQINAINSAQFQKGSNYEILLNPKNYFTTLPAATMENFGVATHFFDEDHDTYPIIRRVITSNLTRSGVVGYITYEDHNNYFKMQNENVNGTITNIYGYKIGEDLHFYPMFNIENFFKNSKTELADFNTIIDPINKKLKYDIYFRRTKNTPNGRSVFEKVYIDFLYKNYETIGHPYILYYIDEEGKRQIIYIHTEEGASNKTLYQISNDIKKYNEYINNFYDIDTSGSNLTEFGDEDVYLINEGLQYPYLYHINNSSRISLFVQTPNTSNFSLTQDTLPIQYFKNDNTLKSIIKIGDKILELVDDKEQDNGVLYAPKRYNIPDNSDINIEISGTFLRNNSQIKFDDEYTDILLPNDGNGNYVSTDIEAQKYYYYNGLGNNGKRQFVQFQTASQLNSFFTNDNPNSFIISDIDNIKCGHVYIKNDEAYKLKCEFTTNSLINQITEYKTVVDEVENIQEISNLTSEDDGYVLTFNYALPDQIEQLKFDLNLRVDETSKVKSTEINLPLSLNKIHQPCIQFVSKSIINKEISNYNNYFAYTFGDKPNNAGQTIKSNYMYTNKETSKLLSNTAGNKKTNQNTIQGETPDDQFNTFTELYTYVLERKYNNFEIDSNYGPVRTDLLTYIYGNYEETSFSNLDLETTFNYNYTYDNSGQLMRKLMIAYHPQNNMLNLIGGTIFDDYLKSVNSSLVNKQSFAYLNNVTYYPEINKQEYIRFKNIFNINGLGFNYRLHGGDSYLYINREGSDIGSHAIIDYPFNVQYDLLSNCCNNDSNNICKFMEISIEDGDNQITNITKQGSELSGNNINLINTSVVDIYMTSYTTKAECDFYRLSNNLDYGTNLNTANYTDRYTMTYHIPIVYMVSKSTTFYPDQNIMPTSETGLYDLTNNTDITKYHEYIEYWNSNSNIDDELNKYKSITLSLQLKENLDGNTPFFYESNKAKLKFDIRRIKPSDIDNSDRSKYSISGRTVKLGVNQKYYLADLINAPATLIKLNSIGSYPQYNSETGKYNIVEIFDNSSNNNSSEVEEPNSIIKINGEYKYDVKKCAILNKIHFTTANVDTANNTIINISDDVIDLELRCFEINDSLINSLTFRDIQDGIEVNIGVSEIYGNKLYLNNSLTSNPKVGIEIIHRTKPTNISDDIVVYDNNNDHSNRRIITNKNLENGYFIYYNTNGMSLKLRHYRFYELPLDNTIELFDIPAFNKLNKLYIYSIDPDQMTSLANYMNINTQEEFNRLYGILLTAFENNNIYELVEE